MAGALNFFLNDITYFLEILYGFAPYHSRTIEELHLKVLNDTPIIVNNNTCN